MLRYVGFPVRLLLALGLWLVLMPPYFLLILIVDPAHLYGRALYNTLIFNVWDWVLAR